MQFPSDKRCSSHKHTALLVVAVCLLTGVMGWFRWQWIELRPVHTDEAENAWILARDISGSGYTFNPKHHHGPTLNYWLKPVAWIWGYQRYADMEIVPLRAALWLTGMLTLFAFVGLRSLLGNTGVGASMLLAGSSGLLTYYANYVIHETLFGLLAVMAIGVGVHALRQPAMIRWLGLGLIAGCLLATKQTALIVLASWVGAGCWLLLSDSAARKAILEMGWTPWLVSGGMALLTTSALYSQFFTQPMAVVDAVRSLWTYEADTGHAKPWYYYLVHLLLPLRQPPYGSYDWALWGGSLLIIPAMLARGAHALPLPTRRLGIFLSGSLALQVLLYSMVGYKTPWLMVVSALHAALLAGIGVTWLVGLRPRVLALVLSMGLGIACLQQVQHAQLLNGRYHSDPRNPLAYAPTSANLQHLPGFLQTHLKSVPDDSQVGVYGRFIWPLPWYLRRSGNVNYHVEGVRHPPEAVWVLTEAAYAELDPGWMGGRQVFPYTLRPNVPVYLCMPVQEAP